MQLKCFFLYSFVSSLPRRNVFQPLVGAVRFRLCLVSAVRKDVVDVISRMADTIEKEEKEEIYLYIYILNKVSLVVNK